MSQWGPATRTYDGSEWLLHQDGDGFYLLVCHEEELATETYSDPRELVRDLMKKIDMDFDTLQVWYKIYHKRFATYEPP